MQYSSKDYEFLGKQVAAGQYVGRTTFLLALVLVLLVGLCLGRYVFPSGGSLGGGDVSDKRPLGESSSSPVADQQNKQLLQSIFQHEEELRKNPENAEAWEHLGNLYFDTGEPEKAIRAYNNAIERNPKKPGVLVDCGIMYRRTKQYDKALEYFDRALAIDAKHPQALFARGIVLHFDLKRTDEALQYWRKLLGIDPNFAMPSGEPLSKFIESLS